MAPEPSSLLEAVFATKDHTELMVVRSLLASGGIPSTVPTRLLAPGLSAPSLLTRRSADDDARKHVLYVRAEDAEVARELLASFDEVAEPVPPGAYQPLAGNDLEADEAGEAQGGGAPRPIEPR